MNLFKKKEIFKVTSKEVKPDELPEPKTANEFLERGMAYYARKRYEQAEVDLRSAIALESNSIDAWYCLGMVLKAQRKYDES
jgi:Tfp pilus assembly protein PilF